MLHAKHGNATQEPRVSGNKVIFPMNGRTNRERNHFERVLSSRLRDDVERVWLHDGELYCRVKGCTASRRELTAQRLLRTVPPLLSSLANELANLQTTQQRPGKLAIPGPPEPQLKGRKPQRSKRGGKFATKGRAVVA